MSLLSEAIAALHEAAENERSMRIGHDVAGVLYEALSAAQAPAEAAEVPEHQHAWQVVGYHRPEGDTLVVQACACGDAREIVAGLAA